MFLDDRVFIENKYHDTNKPFDPYMRMAYHGWEGNRETGKTIDQIKEGLKCVKEQYSFCSHEVIKARSIEYVLQNTQIEISEHDYFPLIYTWNREIAGTTFNIWREEMNSMIKKQSKTDMDLFCQSGVAVGWPDFDHVVPDWDSVLKLGFVGIRKRANDYKELAMQKAPLTNEQQAFFDGIEIEYTAIINFVKRLYDYSLTKSNEKSVLISNSLRNLSSGEPKTFLDALMIIYLYFMISESVDYFQVRSLGNGLDHSLYPFYVNDIKNGVFSREEIKEFLRYFLMQWQAIGNYWGQPFYLGGSNLDGTTRINDLSYDIVDVYSKMGIYNPKIQIKYNKNIPTDFLNIVLNSIRKNIGSYVFCCEPTMIEAIMSYGASYEEAYDYDIRGCYETGVRANEVSAGNFYINMLKCVEYVFSNGFDKRLNKQVGIKVGKLEDYKTFSDFYNAFIKQWGYIIDRCLDITIDYEKFLGYVNPSSMYSATIKTSLINSRDGYQSGVKFNNSATLCCGFGTAVDALMAVYDLVFNKKEVSLLELKDALDNNWAGYEKLRFKALNSKFKYGNNEPLTDKYARALSTFFATKVANRTNSRGGVFKPIMHTAMMFLWEGQATLATPDGRVNYQEMSKNASPTPGADKNGVTAFIQSALKLQPKLYTESFCIDVFLHTSAVIGDDGLVAMKGLLDGYLEGGGQSMQFNVFNVEMLEDAQLHPEKYKNLQVRVCGWNVLWNNLSKTEQDAYIRRTKVIK